MSSTLLLLAEAALFLLSLFIYLRVRQVLQEIRHERIAWEGVSELVDELSALMEVLSQVPLQMEEDLEGRSLHNTRSQLSLSGTWTQGNGAEQPEDTLAGWHELFTAAPSTVPSEEEKSSATPPADESVHKSYPPAWGSILPQKYELVLHLAEQGWSPLEIAQHTHLGHEEVQLILSLWQRGRGN